MLSRAATSGSTDSHHEGVLLVFADAVKGGLFLGMPWKKQTYLLYAESLDFVHCCQGRFCCEGEDFAALRAQTMSPKSA